MRFDKMVLASFLALSMVACGDADDAAKPDDPKNNIPERPENCAKAGDKCQFNKETGEWEIKKDGEGQKGEDDKPDSEAENVPAAESTFDYSDIGVTDKLEPQKRGFGFYHKGPRSPLDAKWFTKGVTLSPSIPWSSTHEYDPDLYNFVALRLYDKEDKEAAKNATKFMFDKIGEENQKVNPNKPFFGDGLNTVILKEETNSSGTKVQVPTYGWRPIPALVNTYMAKGATWTPIYADPEKKYFKNQEEETKSKFPHTVNETKIVNGNPTTTAVTKNIAIGNGAAKMRVYGVNAFLAYASDGADALNSNMLGQWGTPYSFPAGKPVTPDEKHFYPLATRSGAMALKHPNFAFWAWAAKRKAAIACATDCQVLTIKQQMSATGSTGMATTHHLGTLRAVQFGRLTGEGVDPEASHIAEYRDPRLKPYPFTAGAAAIGGNPKAEDWYFARGTEPTPVETLDKYKNSPIPITYYGQAVMFGIDYDPRGAVTKKDDATGQSTNSVKPSDKWSKEQTLLDGKQNFVEINWTPSMGSINGEVYGVWTRMHYLRANQEWTTEWEDSTGAKQKTPHMIGEALMLKAKDHKTFVPDEQQAGVDLTDTSPDNLAKVLDLAIRLEPWKNTLVEMKGAIVEGTNSFSGKAIRKKDGSQGVFFGAFFGKDASEVGGVINSQTGDMNNKDLVDPAAKWGGAFGAQHRFRAYPGDLIFKDPEIDYGTSTEFFN